MVLIPRKKPTRDSDARNLDKISEKETEKERVSGLAKLLGISRKK